MGMASRLRAQDVQGELGCVLIGRAPGRMPLQSSRTFLAEPNPHFPAGCQRAALPCRAACRCSCDMGTTSRQSRHAGLLVWSLTGVLPDVTSPQKLHLLSQKHVQFLPAFERQEVALELGHGWAKPTGC